MQLIKKKVPIVRIGLVFLALFFTVGCSSAVQTDTKQQTSTQPITMDFNTFIQNVKLHKVISATIYPVDQEIIAEISGDGNKYRTNYPSDNPGYPLTQLLIDNGIQFTVETPSSKIK